MGLRFHIPRSGGGDVFTGLDSVEIWRAANERNRDGDVVYAFHHTILNCSFQPKELSGWLGSEKSDGKTMYAVEADAELYTQAHEDIREGDRVKFNDEMWVVISPFIVHTYPSGWSPGAKVYLEQVRKW